MDEQPESVSISAVARMPSARLRLTDLDFIANTVENVRRVTLTWSSREIYQVTASNFSAQSPSIKVARTFEANSVADFATRAPRGKIYIMEARFESPRGTAVLKLGKKLDLSRDLLLSYEGTEDAIPSWFDEIVKEIVSAKLLWAGQREFYLLCFAWAPVFLPLIAAPWAITSGHLSDLGPLPKLSLPLAGFAWFAYTVFTPTIARFIRASSLRVTPLFAAIPQPQLTTLPSLSQIFRSHLKQFRTQANIALRSGWLAFRQSDHQFNAVLISLVALAVSVVALIFDVSK